MGRSDESTHGARRRTVLKLLSAAAGAAAVPALGAGQTEADEYALVQDGECVPVTPLSGEQPVEELYDWREGETGYSSAGTVDLQRDDTSILFLYDGPNGLSLVLVHGHYQASQSGGGSVSMTFTGLPEDGEWVVEDDRYDGSMNYDNWNHGATTSEIDWTYRFSRTDGGAFRGLDGEFELLIEPAFNDASEFGDEHYDSQIADWQVLSGDREDPDRTSLAMDQAIVISPGGCETSDPDGTEDGDDGTEDGDDGTGGSGDGSTEGEADDANDVVVDEDRDGNVRTDGYVVVENGVTLDGNVDAGGSVEIEHGARVDGNVESSRDVAVASGGEIDGNVERGRHVTVGNGGEIDGNVDASGTVTVRSGGAIDGNVTASSVEVANGAEVSGEIEEESEDEDDGAAESDDGSEDRGRTKHEKQQRKHRKKHEKQQRKHQKKHEKQQRKHEKEEERKERKHEKQQRKHEKQRRKHEKEEEEEEEEEEERRGNGRGKGANGKRKGKHERGEASRGGSDGLGDELTDTLDGLLGSDDD